MNYDSDTDVLEREQSDGQPRKPSRIHFSPLWIALPILVVLALGTTVMFRKMRRDMEKKDGVMEAAYVGRPSVKEFLEAKPTVPELMEIQAPVKVPKFNHVIFRLGDAEIFRFTYEDGGGDMRYSFEVKEGGK